VRHLEILLLALLALLGANLGTAGCLLLSGVPAGVWGAAVLPVGGGLTAVAAALCCIAAGHWRSVAEAAAVTAAEAEATAWERWCRQAGPASDEFWDSASRDLKKRAPAVPVPRMPGLDPVQAAMFTAKTVADIHAAQGRHAR
jgi:hypothetical protein